MNNRLIPIFSTFFLSLLLGCGYATRIRPLSAAGSDVIYKNGKACMESKKTSTLTLCLQDDTTASGVNFFYLMLRNQGTQNYNFDPASIEIALSNGKRSNVIPPSNYLSSVKKNYERDLSGYPIQANDSPAWVMEKRESLKKNYETRIALEPQLLRLNTLRPFEEVQGYVPFEAGYGKIGITMQVLVPTGQEAHTFEYIYE